MQNSADEEAVVRRVHEGSPVTSGGLGYEDDLVDGAWLIIKVEVRLHQQRLDGRAVLAYVLQVRMIVDPGADHQQHDVNARGEDTNGHDVPGQPGISPHGALLIFCRVAPVVHDAHQEGLQIFEQRIFLCRFKWKISE